ncbi:MAG: LptF/LptG family permease [Alphaproteobacteria bacterium]|uniref:LptF/LptG family permease n=1 Tax=Candidatus Nitrobium versatile TaxID=2884831 RepID=A0A953JCH0_9BACT|nr:LptF/LptG family permease [Candidatus Nitrobium versatile]
MLIVQKLYLKDFLRSLALLCIGISLVFSIIGLIDKVDDFMPHRPPAGLLLLYTVLTIPKYLQYLIAMATLLSSLFVFSQAIKRKEIVAIKAASGRMKSILMPFVSLGVLLTLTGFLLGEVVIPATSKKIREVKGRITKSKKGVTFKEGTLYMRARDGSIVRIGLYLPDLNLSKEVSIFKFDAEALKERINAETALWEGNSWKLRKVTVYDIAEGKTTSLPELVYPHIESPKIFQEDLWEVSEMNIVELVQYQNRLNEAGFKNVKLTVDISSRLSYPLINLFMLLLGISLSMGGEQQMFQKLLPQKSQTHGGIIAAGLGLFISLVYWFGYSLFLSLGYAGAIPPFLAPWIIPFVFAGLSVYLYRQIPE